MVISSATSGLQAASFRMATSAHDISNATTDGFRQREVMQSSSATGGVKVQGVRTTNESTDLAKELGGEMTIAQNSYSANLKVIKTQDEMMGSLLDIRG